MNIIKSDEGDAAGAQQHLRTQQIHVSVDPIEKSSRACDIVMYLRHVFS